LPNVQRRVSKISISVGGLKIQYFRGGVENPIFPWGGIPMYGDVLLKNRRGSRRFVG